MNISTHIVSTGARTPLGLHAASSAAAYRAGISAAGEHPFMIDRVGDPMPGALDSAIDPQLTGPDRLLALAETALREVCAPLGAASGTHLRLPLFLGLSELRPGFTAVDAEAVRAGLGEIKELPIDISEVRASPKGHASGLAAFAAATAQIQAGAIEACLVGGIDSYFHPDTMEWLDDNRQLAGAVSRSAFVPGEGAGFCLLMADRARERVGMDSLARVCSVSNGSESKLIKTSQICLGAGLCAVVQSVASVLHPHQTINAVICDINGERYRGEEWGFVCLRLSRYFDDPTAYWSPADSWGDMGAASGPLFAMLTCESAARGYASGSRTLLWASSEGGQRGAALLETAA